MGVDISTSWLNQHFTNVNKMQKCFSYVSSVDLLVVLPCVLFRVSLCLHAKFVVIDILTHHLGASSVNICAKYTALPDHDSMNNPSISATKIAIWYQKHIAKGERKFVYQMNIWHSWWIGTSQGFVSAQRH